MAEGSETAVDVKPRSRDVTDGPTKAPARAMLRAVGMGDDDWDKPQIGVASAWNEITPCNLTLRRLAQQVKAGVHEAGGFPLEFGTITVCDGISMGHEGMRASLVSREVICDSVETVVFAERLDGFVGLAGCDKRMPGDADGRRPPRPGQRARLQRLDHARAPRRPGPRHHQRVRGGRGLRRGHHHRRRAVEPSSAAACPGEGACGGMFTANTMSSIGEASGSRCPGSASPPAIDARRDGDAHRAGRGGGRDARARASPPARS